MRGRQSRFMVYELLGIRDALDAELRAGDDAIELCALTSAAKATLKSGRIAEATMRYDAIVDKFPAMPSPDLCGIRWWSAPTPAPDRTHAAIVAPRLFYLVSPLLAVLGVPAALSTWRQTRR